jgi:hypothetical protein
MMPPGKTKCITKWLNIVLYMYNVSRLSVRVRLLLNTYFGENTLQTNKWFLMSSKTIVYEVKATELMSKGSKHGIVTILSRI